MSELPNALMREVGEKWLRRYGRLIKDDPAFVAASVYRMMHLAKTDPAAREIVGLIGNSHLKSTCSVKEDDRLIPWGSKDGEPQ